MVIRFLCLVSILGMLTAGPSARGEDPSQDEQTFADAAAVLRDLVARPEDALPADVLQQARGLIIVPNSVRAGLFVGGRRGRGVVVVRAPDGSWSNPGFVVLTGGSIGWQIGAQSADVVFVLATTEAAERIARGRVTLGGDVAVTAGYASEQAAGTVRGAAEVQAYAISRGLFVGVTFEGTRVAPDVLRNRAFYGAEDLALASEGSATPAEARRFLLALADIEGRGAPPATWPDGYSDDEATLYPLGP